MLVECAFTDTSDDAILNARIVQAQIRLLEATTLSEAQRKIFVESLLMLARKLLCVWTHFDRFRRKQGELELTAPVFDSNSKLQSFQLVYSQDLFMELDEFLVQYKSSLDHLAKIPISLLGKDKWNPRSFGDKGERLVRMLKSAIPKSERHLIPAFEALIFKKHKTNFELIIDARDRINHYVEGGLDYRNFSVFGIKQHGIITLRVPMWSADQRIVDFMEVTFGNLISFCENFITFFLGLSRKPGLVFVHKPVPAGSVESPCVVITESQMQAQLQGIKPDLEFLRES